MLALLVLALVLRCFYLNRSLWLDEGLSLEQAFDLDGKDGQRPLYFLFLALWTHLGSSAIWLRLPSVIFGVAGVGVFHALARRLAGPRVAFLAALFMTVATPMVWHSQEIRMYSLAPLLMLLSALSALRWLEQPTRRRLAAHGVFVVLTLLCHTLAFPGLAALGALAFASAGAGRARRALAASYALALVVWSPCLYLAATHRDLFQWVRRPGPLALLGVHDQAFVMFPHELGLRAATAAVVIAFIAVALAKRKATSETAMAATVAFWFYASIAALFVASLVVTPMWVPRYFTIYGPALFLLTAMGVVAIEARARVVAGVGVGAILLLQLAALKILRHPEEDWRAAAGYVEDHAAPGDSIFVMNVGNPPPNVWSFYFKGPSTYVVYLPELPRWSSVARAATPDHAPHIWIAARLPGREDRPQEIAAALGPGAVVHTKTFLGVLVVDASAATPLTVESRSDEKIAQGPALARSVLILSR